MSRMPKSENWRSRHFRTEISKARLASVASPGHLARPLTSYSSSGGQGSGSPSIFDIGVPGATRPARSSMTNSFTGRIPPGSGKVAQGFRTSSGWPRGSAKSHGDALGKTRTAFTPRRRGAAEGPNQPLQARALRPRIPPDVSTTSLPKRTFVTFSAKSRLNHARLSVQSKTAIT